MYSDEGELTGILGIGVDLSVLKSHIHKLEKTNDSRAFMIRDSGIIYLSGQYDFFDNKNILDINNLSGIKLSNNKHKNGLFDKYWTTKTTYLVDSYFKNIDLHLIVEKNTEMYLKELICILVLVALFGIVIIVFINIIISRLVATHEKEYLKK